MAFHKHLPVKRRKILQAFGERILHFRQFFHTRSYQFENRSAFRFLGPTRKRAAAQISSESDPAADYTLVMRPFTAQPFSGGGQHIGKFHDEFGSSLCSCLIGSRNEAAVS